MSIHIWTNWFGWIEVTDIKNDAQCFIRYPDTEKWVEKRGAAENFKTDFEVSGYRMKHWVEFLI